MKRLLPSLLLGVLIPLTGFAGNITPGLWKAKVTATSNGPNGQNTSEQTSYCITESDPIPALGNSNTDACRILKHSVSGSTVSWKMSCDTPLGKMVGIGKIIYQGEQAHGKLNMVIDTPSGTVKMQQTVVAKRIGDC